MLHPQTENTEFRTSDEKDNKNVFNYDVVVMGAGPAAFSLALQFAKQDPNKGPPKTLAILSSNPAENENNHYGMTQLMQGKLSGLLAQRKYKDYLYMGRLREFGGTTNHWGGWSWPLEQYEISNWPIEYSELEKYWRMTQYDVMNLGSKDEPQYKYDDIDWWIQEGKKKDKKDHTNEKKHDWEAIPETSRIKTRILQVHPINFKHVHLKTIHNCPWIKIHHNCNVVKVETVRKGDICQVTTMVAKEILEGGNVGRTLYFNASDHVLAAGAIENTRFLLLNKTEQFRDGIGNSSGHLGKHFRDQNFFNNYEMMSFTLKDDCPAGIKNFYFNLDGNKLYGESTFTATLVPKVEFVKEKNISSFRCVFGGVDQTPHIGIIAASVEPQDAGGFIGLTDTLPVDIFGQQRVHVHWELTDGAIKTAEIMFDEIFKVLAPYIDPNKINRPDMKKFTNWDWCPDLHPAGTTRMAYRREDGVVDSNLRVFDTSNLYVTGSSTFPSSGYENPTFTICALATRLADHLISKRSSLLTLTRNISNITIESTLQKLQQSLMLELSTIPLYLSAMYSLVENPKNEEKYETQPLIGNFLNRGKTTWYDFAYPRLWSIVKQEMLHMALVANVINAIGGSPKFNDKTQIPQYPGIGLPGGCLQSMKYSLGPFTMERVLKIFLRIEHPHQLDRQQIEQVIMQLKAKMPPDSSPISDEIWKYLKEVFDSFPESDFTIGQFYEQIVEALRYLDGIYEKELWKGNPCHQVTVWGHQLGGKMIKVVDLTTALEAINEVVKEGEGFTIPTSPGDGQSELAHFFKFLELFARRAIVKSEAGYAFDQEEVPFSQEKDVINMITLEKKVEYKGKVAAANFGFNVAYTSLLAGLDAAFNGQPSRVPMMVDIPNDFKNTMSYKLEDGRHACPTFEWVDSNSTEKISSKAFYSKMSSNFSMELCPVMKRNAPDKKE